MRTLFLTAGLAVLSVPALAASISVANFDAASYASVVSGYGNAVTEDFESFAEGNVADGFATSVGTFATLGGIGSGGTVSNADFANDGSMLAVRDGNVYGRTSTTSQLTND